MSVLELYIRKRIWELPTYTEITKGDGADSSVLPVLFMLSLRLASPIDAYATHAASPEGRISELKQNVSVLLQSSCVDPKAQ